MNLSEEDKEKQIKSLKSQLADKASKNGSLFDKNAHLTKVKNELELK